MLISASRRTDIPAYYSEWFLNRLQEGEVLVPNVYNENHLSRVQLTPEEVECIIFWTKNPIPMIPRLKEIDAMGYQYYFEYTITGFGADLEPFLPKREERIDAFIQLSQHLGIEKVDWRFDPIMLNHTYTMERMTEEYEILCEQLHPYTNRCIISFVDAYKRKDNSFQEMGKVQMQQIAERIAGIAKKYDLPVYTCAEKIDLSAYGIQHSACVNQKKIEKIIGSKIDLKKDKTQREICGCLESIDVGMYDTCANGCRYCYANRNNETSRTRQKMHSPDSPILIGYPTGEEVISKRAMMNNRVPQLSLFDYLKGDVEK